MTYQELNCIIGEEVQNLIYSCKEERVGEPSYTCCPLPRQIAIGEGIKDLAEYTDLSTKKGY
jgi:hypothetical protein